ncbi:putative mitochondrial hypothetical protein [Leptomonas pyrrhocoris]|uniref:Uncharacterized protein n=1 Tax=Leptomonas pyrrhocoris TaxID=157538 RepID=A0A0N0VGF6_LEPPY|nr:putative mitochondrial hypothetical protein [Leptomonas pyrrhocoris]KPA82884.1 putative mitochondrial hypothetical protein [Leptomonas pyrrhocoris]|eukprot:XP_015661323.1 putative mitochondrial hypothetical protein [Leptomonas pyrrhocoris]
MSVIITKQRYNWMGYNGTETEEVDTALLRGDKSTVDNYNYDHRQQVIAELKERLYQIKRDLDLLPEEELRAEEEARQRRRDERKRREEEGRRQRAEEEATRAEEEERQRIEQEERAEEQRRQQEADEVRRREQEAEAQRNADRWRQLHGDSDADSDVEEEQNEALSAMPRTQEEINSAVAGFSKGTRMLLAANGQGYVSYIDGSVHSSIEKLEAHNEKARGPAETATAGSSVSIPPAAEYSLDDVRAAAAHRQLLRKKLDAYRVLQDPTYAARIRSSEKDARGHPTTAITPEDGDEATIAAKLQEAKQHSEEVRKAYNDRATASANAIATATCPRAGGAAAAAPEAPKAEETAPAAEAEQQAEDKAAAPPAAAEDLMKAEELSTPAAAASRHSSKKATPKDEGDEL